VGRDAGFRSPDLPSRDGPSRCDDAETRRFLAKGLREAGYVVDEAADGDDGLHEALEGSHDVAIVDRMLPGRDGLSVIQEMRSAGNTIPVLILSALGEVDDRVQGLRAGGDDYLVKPFAFAELTARLEALTRRHDGDTPSTQLRVADLEMDLLKRTVQLNSNPQTLSLDNFSVGRQLLMPDTNEEKVYVVDGHRYHKPVVVVTHAPARHRKCWKVRAGRWHCYRR